MTELIKKAIERIDKESEKKGTNGKLIAQYIIDNLIYDDASAQKILDEKKTFSACIDSIKAEARKEASDGMAMIENETVYEWVRKFYGIQEQAKKDNVISLSLADLI